VAHGSVISAVMPIYRPDLAQIAPYEPGLPVDEVARRHGLDPASIIKLASNESPWGPFPEATEAMARAATGTNRYPDNEGYELREALAKHLAVDPAAIWLGGGSSDILRAIALAVGGPGTKAVYGWPSFIIYRLGAMWAMSDQAEVPLDSDHRYDLVALSEAVDDRTSLVFVCNPNNPSSTHLPTSEVVRFVESVPERVTVVVDEAYHEFVTAADYTSMVEMAAERHNLIVTRTFSKIFALASVRVGYAVTHPNTIAEMRRAQAPFTVTQVGQAGATASLGNAALLAARIEDNARGRGRLLDGLEDRGIPHADSQANFVWFRSSAHDPGTAYIRAGVIIRTFGSEWVRVTVGSDDENTRFLEALDEVER
jgi:histidinol-phosphate aminotransferase